MAEETAMKKGVVVEFDFAAMNGAELLYRTTEKIFKDGDIPFDAVAEARYLAGGNLQGALAEYFAAVKTKKTAQKAAKDITDAFRAALGTAIPKAVTPGFKAFVKALVDKGLKVVIATRADIEAVKPAFEEFDPENVVLYSEPSMTYGNCKWDAWRRAYSQNGLVDVLTVAVSGSGAGVKAALVAGMGVVAVIHDHVAYQDFGGADFVTETVDAKLADEVLRMLHA